MKIPNTLGDLALQLSFLSSTIPSILLVTVIQLLKFNLVQGLSQKELIVSSQQIKTLESMKQAFVHVCYLIKVDILGLCPHSANTANMSKLRPNVKLYNAIEYQLHSKTQNHSLVLL